MKVYEVCIFSDFNCERTAHKIHIDTETAEDAKETACAMFEMEHGYGHILKAYVREVNGEEPINWFKEVEK